MLSRPESRLAKPFTLHQRHLDVLLARLFELPDQTRDLIVPLAQLDDG